MHRCVHYKILIFKDTLLHSLSLQIYNILCIVTAGMNKESKEFAGEMFRALARRYNISADSINKAQLKEFWDQISDESFDSRLQIFFDM